MILHHFLVKVFQSETISSPYFSDSDSESLKMFDIQLWEEGAKRSLYNTSKVNTQTDTQTHIWTNRLIESIGP